MSSNHSRHLLFVGPVWAFRWWLLGVRMEALPAGVLRVVSVNVGKGRRP